MSEREEVMRLARELGLDAVDIAFRMGGDPTSAEVRAELLRIKHSSC